MTGITGRDERTEVVRMYAPLPRRTRHRAAVEVDPECAQPGVVDLELVGRHHPVPDGGLRELHSRAEFDRKWRGGWGLGGLGARVHGRLLSPASGGPHFDPFPVLPLPTARKRSNSPCFHHLRRVVGASAGYSSKGRTAIAANGGSVISYIRFQGRGAHSGRRKYEEKSIGGRLFRVEGQGLFSDLLQRGSASRRTGGARLPDRSAARGTRPLRSR